jgi:hypothetical protein
VSAAGADPALAALLTPEAVRERCNELWQLAERDALEHFELHAPALEQASAQVLDELARNYPGRPVPYHSRWRHFELGGRDLWHELAPPGNGMSVHERARARFDLAIVSVLLDAGAGAEWRYRDAATGFTLGRSEGLALASLRLFASGRLSAAAAREPLRCDASCLAALRPEVLADAMQSAPGNPLAALAGRCALLRRLGEAALACPGVFDRDGATRPGHLYDHLRAAAVDGRLPARTILIALLTHLGDIWPGGRQLGAWRAGDVGVHPALRRTDASDTLVPFHKLSQWLAYSLVEPLQEAGIEITEPDALTGLAEYRNGGLLIDAGVLQLRDPAARERAHDPGATLVVEWRALTVAALDRIAVRVRAQSGHDAASLPLAAVLQAGTWSAGRRLAAQRRAGGMPPLRIASDGTLF